MSTPVCVGALLVLLLASPFAYAAAPVWTSVGLSGGGAMTTPAISPADPNWMILNCDMSGAYQSHDGGKTWQMFHYQQLVTNTQVPAAFHPTDPKVAFKLSGWSGGLRKTVDKGATWQEVPGVPRDVTVIAFDPGHPESMFLGSRGSGVYRSADGGKTWAAGTGLTGPVVGLHIDQTSRPEVRTCFAATDQHVFRSGDGGATWEAIAKSPAGRNIIAFSGGSKAQTGGSKEQTGGCVLYLSSRCEEVEGKVVGGIFRSDDRGATWVPATGTGLELMMPGRRGGPARPAQYDYVLTTNVNPSCVYTARYYGGRVYRSDDRGATWRSLINMNMSAPDFNVGPDYLIDERGGTVDNASGFNINPANPEQAIVTGWMACNITTDGGKTWAVGHTRSAETPPRRGPGQRWINTGLVVTTVWHYYLDPFEPNRHYIAYTDIGYARSTDAGKTWYWTQKRPLRNTTYEMAFDPGTPGKMWAACADLHDIPNNNVISGAHYRPTAGGCVAVSTDFGATWQDTSQGLPNKPIVSVVVDPKSPKGKRTLYAAAFEDGVYKSTDDGVTWVKKSEGLGAPGVNVRVCRIILHPDGTLFCLVTALRDQDRRYVPEGPGLYRSRDGGERWEQINQSQPLLWPKDFDVDPRDSKVIYLGAADANSGQGGLYKTVDGGTTWKRVARKGPETFGATINPRKPDWVYMCLTESAPESGLWLSKDGGETWKSLDGLPFKNAQRVTFDPKDPSVIYVSTFGGSVWKGPAD